MEKKTFYYAYRISAHFSIADEVCSFYFTNKETAFDVRDLLFECSDKVGEGNNSYCANVTVPNKTAIEENDLDSYNIYKSVDEFVKNDKVFEIFYGKVYNQNNLSI